MNCIFNWGSSNLLKFNSNKTAILYIPIKKNGITPVICIDGIEIPISIELKYLGVWFDKSFNFETHLRKMIDKAYLVFIRTRLFCNRVWGPDSQTTALLFKSIIIPILTYASSIFIDIFQGTKAVNNRCFKKIRSFFASICRSNLDLSRSDLFKQCCFECPDDLSLIISKFDPISTLNYESNHEFQIEPMISWNNFYDLSKTNPIIFLNEDPSFKFKFSIYSDGSKSNKGVGAGYVIYDGSSIIVRNSLKLDFNCSNFQAELIAILGSLESLELNCILQKGQKIIIYSDSLSSLKLINDLNTPKLLAQSIQSLAFRLTNLYGVTFFSKWLKGHSGIVGNEIADLCAKNGAKSLNNSIYDLLPCSPVKINIKNKFWNFRIKEVYYSINPIDHSPVNNWTRHFLHKNPNRTKICNFRELTDFYSTQFITGHGKFSKYLNDFGVINAPYWPLCNYDEDTPEHVFLIVLKLLNSLMNLEKWVF